MQLLRDIIADGGLATAEKKQQFLTILTEKHAEIEDFLNNRPARFTEYFSASLQGLDVETENGYTLALIRRRLPNPNLILSAK